MAQLFRCNPSSPVAHAHQRLLLLRFQRNAQISPCPSITQGIGNQIAQRIKQENDKVYGKYRKIYAKKAMLVKRNPDIEVYKKDYEKWKKEAKKFMNEIRNETKSYDEFNKWLTDN